MTMLLQELATRRAGSHASAPAIRMSSYSLSYGELETLSNQIARLLRDRGVTRLDRVCLFLPKSPLAIAAMLGVLKADCIYVPIDLASPPSRIAKIVAAADPAVAFVTEGTPSHHVDALHAERGFSSIEIVSLDVDELIAVDSAPHVHANSSDDPAHILFTSGSTGDPKGVVVTHRNVASFIDWATSYFGMSAGERISGHPPLHFDLSTFDIYGSFAVGAELWLVPPEANLLPHELARFIEQSKLTQWFSVPSTMTYMAKFDALPAEGFEHLERVIWCGEVLPTPILRHWMERVPQASFTNLYGPTETTIASSYYSVPQRPSDDTTPIPIGVPCRGEELMILDESLVPAPPDAIGELYIGGVGVTRGYWRDEERTAAAFVPDPKATQSERRVYKTGDLCRLGHDGLVYFVGRNDSQVKSRGYRIELGEIESALATLAVALESAVVAVGTDGFEGTSICCAFVPAVTHGEPAKALQHGLRRLLPPYMIPTRWRAMPELPKNQNGKIDRRALKDLFAEQGREPDLASSPQLG